MSRKEQKNFGCEGFRLELSAAINRLPGDFAQSQVSISPDGKLVALSPLYFEAPEEGSPALILYRNTGDGLEEIARLDVDPAFPLATGAATNESLTLFALLEVSEEGTLRIRVFELDCNLQLAEVRTIELDEQVDVFGATVLFPQLFRNHYATISFTNTDNQLVVLVVDVNTGAVVARVTPQGAGTSNIAYLFELDKKVYLAVGTGARNAETGAILAPFFLEIYRLNCPKTVLVERVGVPNFLNDIDSPLHFGDGCETLLAVGTSRAIGIGQANIIPPRVNPPPAVPPPFSFTGEPGGVLVYHFDGKRLALAALIPQLIAVVGVEFYPDGDYIAVNTATSAGAIAFDQTLVYRLERGCDPSLEQIAKVRLAKVTYCPNLVDSKPAPASSFISQFSDNGKWFAVSGGYGAPTGLPQLLLYRVFAKKC